MIAILEKSEHNVDFHTIVDFVEASPLRYALTFKPTLYVFHIRQFWSTTRIETTIEGTKILATVDGILRTITKSSIGINLKLQDKEGIGSLPDSELFENLTLTGYNISPNQKFTFQKVDEPASPLRDVSQGEACPTDSGFEAYQDRANIAKSFTLPYDSASRVTSPAAVEGRVAAEGSGDDAPIKGRNLDEGEAATERVSDDTEEIETVLTSMDADDVVPTAGLIFATATVVARELEEQLAREDQRMSEQITRDAEVARIHVEEELQSMIDGLDRSNETIAKYLQEYQQFASELPLERRIELISDLVRYQDNYAMVHKFQTQQRKPWSKKQKRDYYMAVIRNNLGWKVKDLRGMSFEEIEAKFTTVWKQLEDFIPMGSKEEAERIPSSQTPIIDWKVHTEGQRSYWKIIRLGGSSASYQIFVDLLKHMDREDLNKLWALGKESLNNMQPTSNKDMEL
uniref:Uncharacterized protein n=1 Tax=Tanacetum cinerariifolium TaxID=118510 RepID=A0A6L2KCN4_TANCI|nr:hypothetical protein [Tanacetum cinerariifolium]